MEGMVIISDGFKAVDSETATTSEEQLDRQRKLDAIEKKLAAYYAQRDTEQDMAFLATGETKLWD